MPAVASIAMPQTWRSIRHLGLKGDLRRCSRGPGYLLDALRRLRPSEDIDRPSGEGPEKAYFSMLRLTPTAATLRKRSFA